MKSIMTVVTVFTYLLQIDAATSNDEHMAEDITTVMDHSGMTDILTVRILQNMCFYLSIQIANRNTISDHLTYWEAIIARRTALDQLKDGLRNYKLLTAVQLFPEAFRSFFVFQGTLTADTVLSCISSIAKPTLFAILKSYL